MLTTTLITYVLTMNDAAIVGVPKDTDIAAFLDSVAADAGYLATDSTVIKVELPMGALSRDPIDEDNEDNVNA